MDQKHYTVLGKVTSPFGIQGWVKVHSFTEPMENILNYKRWVLVKGTSRKEIKVNSGKPHSKGIVVKLAGCNDRDAAAALGGSLIEVETDQLPKLEVGEYYWHQLEGLRVVLSDGRELGVISHLMETGSNDVLVVKASVDSIDDRERLVPYLPNQVVKNVDLGSGVIEVEWDPEF